MDVNAAIQPKERPAAAQPATLSRAATNKPAACLRLMRPEQWTKNLFLFAGLVFGQKLIIGGAINWTGLFIVTLGFGCFSLVSSATYVLNDIHDRNEDRMHPIKRRRPIAAGVVTVPEAILLSLLLYVGGLGGAFLLDRTFFAAGCTYMGIQLVYTFLLKHVVLVDVIIIGVGFVLRAIAGALLVHVVISQWLVLCTFTLCLFMGFSKRRCELNALSENGGSDAARHRRTLAEYTPDLLNHMTTLSAGIAVVSFMLYANDDRTLKEFGTNYLVYTLPLVIFAVFRFALLVEHGRVDGPTAVLLRDRPFQVALLLWAAAAVFIVYWGKDVRDWLANNLKSGGP